MAAVFNIQAYGAEDDRVFGIPGEVIVHMYYTSTYTYMYNMMVSYFRTCLEFTQPGPLLGGTMASQLTKM